MADHGSHMFDLAHLCLGDIAQVSAHVASYTLHPGPDGNPMQSANDTAACLAEFASGGQGTFLLSSVAYLADWEVEQTVTIYGEAGTLHGRMLSGSPDKALALYGARIGGAPFQEIPIPDRYTLGMPAGPFIPAMLQLITTQPVGPRLFVDSIIAGQTMSPSFFDGYKAQVAIDAALDAQRFCKWVRLDYA